MLTKGAIGNLVNRYKAVLKKCNLINTFGSLAVASMLVLGSAGVAGAGTTLNENMTLSTGIVYHDSFDSQNKEWELKSYTLTIDNDAILNGKDFGHAVKAIGYSFTGDDNSALVIKAGEGKKITYGLAFYGKVNVGTLDITSDANAVQSLVGSTEINAKVINLNSANSSGIHTEENGSVKITNTETLNVVAGENAISATSNFIDIEADKITLSGTTTGIISSSSVKITSEDTNITGAVIGTKGQVTIDATNDITINGNVEARGGEGSGHLPYVSVKADGDTVINGALVAHWAEGSKDGTRPYGLEIAGNTVTVNAGENSVLYNGAGKTNIVATDSLTLNGQNGLVNEGGDIKVSAEKINITAEKAVVSYSGSTEIAPTGVSNITGDIWVSDLYTNSTPTVSVDLGTGGSFTGAVINDHIGEGTGATLDLGTGTWNVTGTSNVTELTLDEATVNIGAGADVTVKKLVGNGGNINMVDAAELGSFTADAVESESPEFKVQAIDEVGNVKNADEVSVATLATMVSNIDVASATVTATVTDGIVNNGYTVTTDAEGNPVISGGGASSITKDVLSMASVNTVALDRILTNDLRKRLGDIRSDANTTGVWMRWDGGKLQGEGLTNNFNTIQIGGDTKVAKNCRLGVAGSFTHGDGDFARGSSELEGFSFAAYATWMGENGMFADVVARLGHFSTEVNVEGQSGDMNNRVASISGEYGWRFNLCDQFFVEPQVELAYTYVSSEDLELDTAKFSFDNVDSLTGRAGLVAGWNLPDDRGNVYARASVVQQFMGDAKVTGYSGVAPTVHETDGDDTWLEYGIGANVKLTDKTYIWADVERTEGADIDEEWRGTVGVRFSF